jgi:type I restriction enzyme, S subunit
MTIVSKASAFPKSVQPGIPALGRKPEGWVRGPLSLHLYEEARPIEMQDSSEYRLVTVKRSRGGVVEREHLKGSDISVKAQFLLYGGDFLISKRQIVHGACGIVPQELDGSIASNEYSILRSKPSLDLEFLNCLAHSSYFQQTCFHSSIGVHVEKMIFKLETWLAWQFDLPPIVEQHRIAEILSIWDRAIAVQEQLVANARAHKKALMQTLLTGKKRLPGFKGHWPNTSQGRFRFQRRGARPRHWRFSIHQSQRYEFGRQRG